MKISQNYGETVRDKLTLSPIEKYIKYNRYPYKLVLSVGLVILTTLATFNLLNIYSLSGQAQIKVWRSILCLDNPLSDGTVQFYTVNDFQNHLQQVFQNLKSLEEILFQKIDATQTTYRIEVIPIFPVADSEIHKKKHKNESYDFLNNNTQKQSFFDYNYSFPININEGIVRPFNMQDDKDIKDFIEKIHKFTFIIDNMKLYINTPQKTVDYHTCWTISVHYSYHEASYILAKQESTFFPCENILESEDNRNEDEFMLNSVKSKKTINPINFNQLEYSEKFMGDSIITLHIAIFLFASASLILNLKYIYEMIPVYLQTLIKSKRKKMMTESINIPEYNDANEIKVFQKKTSRKAFKTLEKLFETDKPWHLLTFREKMLFFDLWFILGIIANMCQMWSSILVFFQEISNKEYHGSYMIEILIGFSCFLAWLTMIRYLEYNKNIFTISNILKRSLPQMLLFIIGFIPIYMAYVFLGVSLFWRYEKFKDPNEATMSLFSLIMGDSIFYFLTTIKGYGLLSLIYFFSFLIIFFMAIQNIFVSIICSKAREKEKEPENRKETRISQDKTDNKTEDSKSDFLDLNRNSNTANRLTENNLLQPNIFKKKKSMDNLNPTVMSESNNPDWKTKTFKRMQTLTPKNSRGNEGSNPLVISTAYKKVLERRATANMNVLPSLTQEGAFTNLAKSMTLKKLKSIKNFKNIELTEFEKERILNEVKYYTEEALALLDDMYRDNVADLEFYKLRIMDMGIIKNEYLQELISLAGKIKVFLKAEF